MIPIPLGPYRLVSELGSGAMGTVYRAEGPDGVVAVKLVHSHLLAEERFSARFLREAEIGRRVRHPNVVRTLDAGATTADGRPVSFLVMEYVEGQTLRDLLVELRRVPEQLCRHVGREAARGLGAIHAAGAVHRDLKPENVLVTKDHVVKVMDLGVARLADESVRLSSSGTFVGSVRYAAPEQFRHPDGIDARADLWALGVVLYELASGVHPFDASDFRAAIRRILDDEPRRLGEVSPQTSPLLEELVAQLLQKDRGRRPASAGDVAEILDRGEDVTWWRARAAEIRTETRRPLRRIRIQRETALHGRGAEIARLRGLFDRAAAGDGQAVLVEGEAGIGKSRLVDELIGLLAGGGEDVDFLSGGWPPGGAATASGAFVAAWREHLGDEVDEAAVREELPQTPLLVPAFAALLRGDATPPGAEPLTRESLATVFVHCMRTLAARRTTIVHVDDLHFAPDEGRALFAALAAAVPGHRVLLVGTTRPDPDPRWLSSLERLSHVTRIPLARLGAKDVARILVEAFRSERLAEQLAFRIATRSDGNPFFVFEILRSLREGGALRRCDDGSWESAGDAVEIRVPSTVRELVDARLADLSEEDRDLLEAAACQGFEFDASLVADALGLPVLAALRRFARIERAQRLVRALGRRHVFDHHQVQQALYDGLFPQLREQVHAATADAIERRAGAASKDPATLDGATSLALADQFLLGGRGDRALPYLDAALSHLEGGFQHEAVARMIDRALGAAGLVAGALRCRLLLRKAAALERLGRVAEEVATLDEARPAAEAQDDPALRAAVLRALGASHARRSDVAAAERAFREALGVASGAGLADEEGRVRIGLAHLALDTGRYDEAWPECDRVLSLARATGAWRLEFGALAVLAQGYMDVGRDADAQAIAEQQHRLARRAGHPASELLATIYLASVHAERGRLAVSLDLLAAALELARRTGDRSREASARCLLGRVRGFLGDLDGAGRDCEAGLSLAREVGSRKIEGFSLHDLGALAFALGDLGEAGRLFAAAADLRRSLGYRPPLVASLVALARVRAIEGRPADVRALLDEALDVADGIGLATAQTDVAVHRAQLLGEDPSAAAVRMADQGSRLDATDAAELWFRLWQATGDRTHLDAARRVLDHLIENAPEDAREAMVRNVRPYREIDVASRRR